MADKVKRTYEPFPEGEQPPDGWPTVYVDKADYDTLKERADALADAVEGVLEYGPAFTAGEEAELDEALTAYREAGPNDRRRLSRGNGPDAG